MKRRHRPPQLPQNKSLPLLLRAEGRRCLVVGGGRVAARKVASLLAAGARVTVVSPAAGAAVARLAAAGRVRHRARRFVPADVRGAFLAVAATDDAAVNGRVLDACRRAGVLCAATDAQWRLGDFITPAVAAGEDLMVAVSTGGRSCRRAKRIKEVLQRHLDLLGACEPLALTARWRAGAVAGDGVAAETAARLRHVWGVHEYVVVADAAGITVLAAVCAAATVGPLLPALLPRAVCRPRFTRGAAAVRLAAERWAVDDSRAFTRAAAQARRDGSVGELLQCWVGVTRRLARRIRSGSAAALTDLYYGKEYERLVATDPDRDAVQ